IMQSLVGLIDSRTFTSQFQISAGLLRFFRPCKDCGKTYNDSIHAFSDCPVLALLKSLLY
ncbi:Uncharacterized protein FKW44_015092, partial [Caligus rogercresseyi]